MDQAIKNAIIADANINIRTGDAKLAREIFDGKFAYGCRVPATVSYFSILNVVRRQRGNNRYVTTRNGVAVLV